MVLTLHVVKVAMHVWFGFTIFDTLVKKVLVSSANMDSVLLVCVDWSAMSIINNSGPRFDPWGTPSFTDLGFDKWSPKLYPKLSVFEVGQCHLYEIARKFHDYISTHILSMSRKSAIVILSNMTASLNNLMRACYPWVFKLSFLCELK